MVAFTETEVATIEPLSAENVRTPFRWSIVGIRDILGWENRRLDAGAFDPDAMAARETLHDCRWPSRMVKGAAGSGVANAYRFERFKRNYVPYSNLPMWQPSSITELDPDPDGYMPANAVINFEPMKAVSGQLLMTRSGTVGKVGYVSRTFAGHIMSDDLIRIECYDRNDSGYLYACLKDPTVQRVLLTGPYGALIDHIEPKHLERMPVPYASEELRHGVNDLIVKSYSLRDDSNDMIREARKLLQEALRLPDMRRIEADCYGDERKLKTYTMRFNDLEGRFDASYHIPTVKAIIGLLTEADCSLTTVSDSAVSSGIILPFRFKRVYVAPSCGRIFIGGKQICELDPSSKKYLSKTVHEASLPSFELHENMTLLTRSGTVGKSTLVPKHWEGWIASDHVFRIVPSSSNIAGYIYAFISLPHTQTLILRNSYGMNVDEITTEQVGAIPFPILNDNIAMKQINDLVLEANEKRHEAYLLEQEALKIVDKDVIHAVKE